jgi:hypothetical protein
LLIFTTDFFWTKRTLRIPLALSSNGNVHGIKQ